MVKAEIQLNFEEPVKDERVRYKTYCFATPQPSVFKVKHCAFIGREHIDEYKGMLHDGVFTPKKKTCHKKTPFEAKIIKVLKSLPENNRLVVPESHQALKDFQNTAQEVENSTPSIEHNFTPEPATPQTDLEVIKTQLIASLKVRFGRMAHETRAIHIDTINEILDIYAYTNEII